MKGRALALLALALAVAAPALAQGLVNEPSAVYRSFPVSPRYRAFLPAEVDLSSAFPRPQTQGSQPSCTAWAVGYALRSYYEHWRRGWDIGDRRHLVSPAFIYDRLVAKLPNCSQGTSISAALELLRTEGAPSLAAAPYDPRQCRLAATPALLEAAQGFRIDGWQTVDFTVLDNVKGELQAGNPVVIGMEVAEPFTRLAGDAVYDDTSAPGMMAHALVVVGYSERRQAFKLMNSWGPGWGDGGFGWISYRAFAATVDRAFVARVGGTPPLATFLAALDRPKPAPPPVSTAPPVAAPTSTLAALGHELKTFDCAALTMTRSAHRAVVAGFVASASDRDRLMQIVRRLPEAQQPATAVAVHPWPQCEALITFSAPLAAPHGLTLAANGGAPATLAAGTSLVLDVTTPDFPSYLYVSYVEASGEAVHLYRPAGNLGRALAPGSRIRIGGGPGQRELRIGPPFGPELIVAVAAASPLFAAARPQLEDARQFLTAFRAATIATSAGGLAGRRVAAAMLTVETVARAAK